MGAELVNKFLQAIGINGRDEDPVDTYGDDTMEGGYEPMDVEPEQEEYTQQPSRRSRASVREADEGTKQARVISVNNGMTSSKMVITQPTCYNDVEEVGIYLKDKKSVIINLENVGKEDARRVLDFLSGATFMIEGNIKKVSSLIYLMTPRTVEIQNDLENNQTNKPTQEQRQSFSWLK